TTCASTWPSCAASSSRTRPARATSSPSPGWATGSSCPPTTGEAAASGDSVPAMALLTDSAAEAIYDDIRRGGGRITVPTRMVVTVLLDTRRHLTADDIIAEVERRTPGVAPSTIYRVLQRLDELEIVEHVHS